MTSRYKGGTREADSTVFIHPLRLNFEMTGVSSRRNRLWRLRPTPLGDRVFDASTGPGGMPYAEYVNRLNALNNGPGTYIIQVIDDIGL
jgi:hypothetical protein